MLHSAFGSCFDLILVYFAQIVRQTASTGPRRVSEFACGFNLTCKESGCKHPGNPIRTRCGGQLASICPWLCVVGP